MSLNSLPPGFVDLGTGAVHIATLRRFTSDVHRFMRHLPLMRELAEHEPGSRGAAELIARAGDVDAFALSLRECGELELALAREIERELARRQQEGAL